MKRPEVQISVVIPVYNRAGIVRRTLDSVAAQTARPLQLILVDNGSTDGSAEVLRHWASAHRAPDFEVEVLDETKPGAACARNRGLDAVRAPWTMFFDSDDVMLPGHLQRVSEALAEYPEADLLGWDVKAYDSAGKSHLLPFEPRNLAWHNIMHGSLATLRYCARTDLFRRAGGWCEQLVTWDDIELGCRLLALGPRVVKLHGTPTVAVYYSAESVSGADFAAARFKSLKALRQIMKSYSRLGPLSHVKLKQAILAADCARLGSADAKGILKEVLCHESNVLNRVAYRLSYYYRLIGGRGAARLFKPLLR